MKQPKGNSGNNHSPLVDAFASLVEGYQRAKKASSRLDPDPAPPSPQAGDFLQDFLRLNVQYVNQVARLGSNYSIIAARALERLYDYVAPNLDEADAGPTVYEAITGEFVTLRLPVENPHLEPCSIEVSCSEFRLEQDEHGPRIEIEFQHPKRSRARQIRFELKPDECIEVRLGIKMSKAFVLRADYCGIIAITSIENLPNKKRRRTRSEKAIVLRRVPA
jgi:hypothetical protein